MALQPLFVRPSFLLSSSRIVQVFLLCCAVWFSHPANGQLSSTNKKAIRYYTEGKQYEGARDFRKAIGSFLAAVESDPNFTEAHFSLGALYVIEGKTEQAVLHYTRVVELSPKDARYLLAHLTLAQNHMHKGNYEAAVAYAKSFLALPKDRRYAKQEKDMQFVVSCAEFAQKAMLTPLLFQVKELTAPLHQARLSYFPTLTADEKTIIFTAREPGGDENIFISHFVDGKWLPPEPIASICTSDNEGTTSLSADGKTLVFAACQNTKERKVVGECDLFISRKIGDNWQPPVNLGPVVNSRSWESQPSLSADGRTLYFVSTRPGGLGGQDIWVTRMDENEQWGTPVNLGAPINTLADDIGPFIHPNGTTLFFSSKGHIGMGGFDLFRSELSANGTWSTPENLGYPVNDHSDQISFFVSANGKTAYYTQDEMQNGKTISSKLVSFDLPEVLQVEKASGFVTGKILNTKTRQPLSARVELINLKSGAIESVVQSDPQNGSYLIVLNEGSEYALYITKDAFLFKSLSFDYQNKENEQVQLDILLDPIETGVSIRLNNIFFESGSYELMEKSVTELDKLHKFLKENPAISVEISGHTDNVGSDQANQKLSQQRAVAVVEYLTNKGISADRLTAKGYGEAQPIASNATEEGRQQNRRIEFKIR